MGLAAGHSIRVRYAHQTVKGKDLVAVILLNDWVLIQPPCPFADQGSISWHESREPEEELGDVIVEKVAE